MAVHLSGTRVTPSIFAGWTITWPLFGAACPGRTESWKKGFHVGQGRTGCGRCSCEACKESCPWLCEGLLRGSSTRSRGLGRYGWGPEGGNGYTWLCVRNRPVLQSHPFLPWGMVSPVSWCIRIIFCRTQRLQFIITRPIFFPFFHSSGA